MFDSGFDCCREWMLVASYRLLVMPRLRIGEHGVMSEAATYTMNVGAIPSRSYQTTIVAMQRGACSPATNAALITLVGQTRGSPLTWVFGS